MERTTPYRIAFLVSDDAYFRMHRLPLARAVRDLGHQVIVMTTEGEERQHIEKEGFLFYPVRFYRRNLNPFKELLTFWDTVRGYRKYRPHLVHQLTLKPIVLGTWAARWSGVQGIVNAITGLGYVFAGHGFHRRVLRKIALWGYRSAMNHKNMSALFENPEDLKLFTDLHVLNPTDAVLMPGSGVDPNRFKPEPFPAEPVTILLSSRMLWDKGVADLIGASRILRSKGLAHRIILAGWTDPGNPTAIPEAQLKAWQEEGLAEWVGMQNDMPAMLNRSHIVCLPSKYREGIPMGLIEAASCGRPMVTTDMPGCRQIVRDGKNGLLVQPSDTGALADALARLIKNAQLREEMGRAGREMVLAEFAVTHVIRQTLAVYEKLLGREFAGGSGEREEA